MVGDLNFCPPTQTYTYTHTLRCHPFYTKRPATHIRASADAERRRLFWDGFPMFDCPCCLSNIDGQRAHMGKGSPKGTPYISENLYTTDDIPLSDWLVSSCILLT